jgi:hypothetical protein
VHPAVNLDVLLDDVAKKEEGARSGYVGSQQVGRLVGRCEKSPYCLKGHYDASENISRFAKYVVVCFHIKGYF